MTDVRFERKAPKREELLEADHYVNVVETADANRDALLKIQEQRTAPPREEAEVKPVIRYNTVEFEVGEFSIKMTRPKFAVDVRAMRILQHEKFADMNVMIFTSEVIKQVLHIEAIGNAGEPPEPINRPANMIEYEALLQRLGQTGLEGVMYQFGECFPPLQASEIRNVKKS